VQQFRPAKDDINSKYLVITDLQKKFDVVYLNFYNDEFKNAIDDIFRQTVIGVDAEYRNEGRRGRSQVCVPTYLQISTRHTAYVFNLISLEESTKAIVELFKIAASDSILKVGHSVENDLRKVDEYFCAVFKLKPQARFHICSIETDLFTIKPPQTMGLSDISYRYLGKFMRKKEREISAGGKDTLTNELQIEYVALDSLMPLEFYLKHKEIINSTFSPISKISSLDTEPTFFVDYFLQNHLELTLSRLRIKVNYLDKLTIVDTVKIVTAKKGGVLITHDKGLLSNLEIRNKIPFFSRDQVENEIKKIIKLVRSPKKGTKGAQQYDQIPSKNKQQQMPYSSYKVDKRTKPISISSGGSYDNLSDEDFLDLLTPKIATPSQPSANPSQRPSTAVQPQISSTSSQISKLRSQVVAKLSSIYKINPQLILHYTMEKICPICKQSNTLIFYLIADSKYSCIICESCDIYYRLSRYIPEDEILYHEWLKDLMRGNPQRNVHRELLRDSPA